ncbi:hypothetical protein, variant [Puccinia striiformis f. sp. tritici PST-78]|uniref:Uncharacterized protein n=1 Tax=Puccinia striiformis f. sp. tritici PST-78 TaxID=1165861 RepID=A0A0L0V1B8_9BASI|nr:hypothetical protein, variant [Puccinia striiformis f. sp. tritici PST-78]
MEAACCTTGDLDHADVYIPHNKNNDCYKTPDEIPYECPKGVVPPVLSIKLREANARGCHKR